MRTTSLQQLPHEYFIIVNVGGDGDVERGKGLLMILISLLWSLSPHQVGKGLFAA
jgi:hypothetical protein